MSEATPEPTAGAAGAAADPGAQLRGAREQRGLSVAKVAETLRVAPNLVSAIEENRYDAFDAPVYVRGLLRSYGNLLGLSPAALIESYEQQSAGPVAPSLIPPTTAERPRHDFGPLRVVALLIAGVLLVAGSYWWWLTRSPATESAHPVAVATTASPAPDLAPAPADTAAGAATAAPTETLAKTPGDAGTPAVAPAGQGVAPAQAAPAVASAAVRAAPPAPVASTAPRVDTAPAPEDSLVVHGLKECWVEIYAPTGARVLYDLVRSGETRRVPGPGPWRVFLGVASAAKLTVGERAVVVPASRRSGGTARFIVAVDGTVQ